MTIEINEYLDTIFAIAIDEKNKIKIVVQLKKTDLRKLYDTPQIPGVSMCEFKDIELKYIKE